MSDVTLTMKKITLEAAIKQIDAFPGLDNKKRNCLRLLTEEMFSMMKNVLNHKEATFVISCEGGTYSLGLVADVEMSEKNKETYLSMSSDGKNAAHRGIIGKMIALAESLSYTGPYYAMDGMTLGTETALNYSYLWSMNSYMKTEAPAENDDWDGMEKSIIVNFADDVLIGVRNSKLEMTVKKSF